MSVFRCPEISLFLTLLLHLTAVTGEPLPSLVVRLGDEVTLPCNHLIDGQDKCDGTMWTFSYSGHQAVALFVLGRTKSDRLSVTGNCSLVIKKVTHEDAGRYRCRQYRSGQTQIADTNIDLSVVTVTKHNDAEMVDLYCSVSTYGPCRHTVKWLFAGEDVSKDVETSQSPCLATVTFTTLHHIHKYQYYEFFRCEVTESGSGRVQLFPFSPQSPGEDPIKTTTASSILNSTAQEARTDCSALSGIMLLMRAAELVLITVVTVLLVRARGNRMPPDDNAVSHSVRSRAVRRYGPAASRVHNDEHEDDVRVNYENFTFVPLSDSTDQRLPHQLTKKC